MKASYLAELQSYASVMSCPLKLAIYWARWGIWTLIDSSGLKNIKYGILEIEMTEAVRVNETASIGDRTIGTTPLLRLIFQSDPAKSCTLSDAGQLEMTIGNVTMFCRDNEITSKMEKDILWIFMQFGEWEMHGPEVVITGDRLDGFQFKWNPKQLANPSENFEFIGALSSMFSRYYAVKTFGKEGVVQTEAEFTPDWFAPLVNGNTGAMPNIPIWRFVLQPNRS